MQVGEVFVGWADGEPVFATVREVREAGGKAEALMLLSVFGKVPEGWSDDHDA